MIPFIVVAYYTRKTFYEDDMKRLLKSLKLYKIPYYIESINSLDSWAANTSYKPTFLKQMMKKFPDHNIVYIDCDAEFKSYPVLFDDLDCEIAVHNFDKTQHPRITRLGFEILSGTIFFKNVKKVYDLIERWEGRCQRISHVWDQRHLENLIGKEYYNLPPEYCTIFDVMSHIKNPVIVHYQTSRKVRRNKGKLR